MFSPWFLLLSTLAVATYGEEINCHDDGPQHFPHPTKWGKFIRCEGGVPSEVPCPEGYFYNSKTDFCYDPKDLQTAIKSIRNRGMGTYYGCPGQPWCDGSVPWCPNGVCQQPTSPVYCPNGVCGHPPNNCHGHGCHNPDPMPEPCHGHGCHNPPPMPEPCHGHGCHNPPPMPEPCHGHGCHNPPHMPEPCHGHGCHNPPPMPEPCHGHGCHNPSPMPEPCHGHGCHNPPPMPEPCHGHGCHNPPPMPEPCHGHGCHNPSPMPEPCPGGPECPPPSNNCNGNGGPGCYNPFLDMCPGYPGYPGYGYPVGTCPICNDNCKVHMLRDAKDCSVFYMCDWGCPIWKRCPRGLHFNVRLQICDYPYRAGCAHGKPQCH